MKDLRICFVGDSFVNGTGDPACLGWAGRICAAARQQGHEITYYNLGIRRQTSRDITQRWLAEVSARLPKGCDGRIVFSFGVNDTTIENGKERVAFDESIENARTMLQNASSLFPTIMIGPPPILDEEQNQRTARLSGQFALVYATLGIAYLEVFTPLLSVREWKEEIAANDGAHPRAGGYAALARLIQDWTAWKAWFA
jgi:lysophospholipase L1-like esterase